MGLGAVQNVDKPPLERSTQGAAYDRNTYSYDHDPERYNLTDRDQNLKLYQERLIANKTRQKTSDVAVGKRVETETARVSVPVEKERVVIERTAGDKVETPIDAASVDFHEGEVARIEFTKKFPLSIKKQLFVKP